MTADLTLPRPAAAASTVGSLAPMPDSTIIYTHTDEAPPSPRTRSCRSSRPSPATAGVTVETRDISLAGRILAAFPDHLTEAQRVPDALAELGELATTPEANIIKLPNISASIPQLKDAIEELQAKGYALPDYPDEPADRRRARRPGPLRPGQGQRREPGAARGQLRPPGPGLGEAVRPQAPALDGRLVARLEDPRRHMAAGDFRSNEQSVTVAEADGRCASSCVARRRHHHRAQGVDPVLAGEVVDATVMRKARPASTFLDRADRRRQGRGRAVLAAPQGHDDEGVRPDHLRARRARRSSRDVFAEHGDALDEAGHQPERRPRQPARGASTSCRTTSAPPSRPPSSRASPTARRWRWSTPTAASPTCTCRATSSSTRRCRR